MKVHYINILLFALPLNILVTIYHEHTQRNHKSTTAHTPKIPMTRLLCECELYAPGNYDNDSQMKSVMENFNKQTQQRFHEYEDHMKTTRQKCKDQCNKEIQKIILKDKLEKQITEQLTTLETKIDTDDIPTCICEKSLADKTENFCLNCGVNMGGGVTLSSGVLGGIGEAAISAWQTTEIAAATQAAIAKGAAAGKIAGDTELLAKFIQGLEALHIDKLRIENLASLFTTTPYTELSSAPILINNQYNTLCGLMPTLEGNTCHNIANNLNLIANYGQVGLLPKAAIAEKLNGIVTQAKGFAEAKAAQVAATKKAAVLQTSKKAIGATSYNWYTTISYSVLAILIIVLIMVIIYLILRYRRKKKMKKKIQYIKLLEE
ncbi:PIR protein, putative [Plasmodium sp. gorilla clade G1]|nr:PIR protein, putative [Plasmodium sp. gorilla clade G1]